MLVMFETDVRESGLARPRIFSRGFWLSFLIVLVTSPAPLLAENFQVLHELEVRWDQDGDHFSPIVTDDSGNLYFAFMAADNRIIIGRKPPNGRVRTTFIRPLRADADRYHATPSIALDANGFIHVFGPMHNSNMDYLRSNLPYSVSGGFTRRDASSDGLQLGVVQSGHRWITYPYVFYDNEFEPWIAYRARAGTKGWLPGTQCAQLARFDSDRRRWDPKGGNSNPDYAPIPGSPRQRAPCFAWSVYSQDGKNGYQAWNVKPHFDDLGRLHYPVRHVRATGSTSWGQDLFYLRSDDGGATWTTADGEDVPANPVVISNLDGRSPAWWADGPTGGNTMYGAYASSSGGRPIVGYQKRTGDDDVGMTMLAVFDDGEWARTETGISAFPGRLLVDSNDHWTLVGGREIHVSTDQGQSWRTYVSPVPSAGQNANVDIRYFKKTNRVRFVASPTVSSGSKLVAIVEFVHDDLIPPR